MWAKQNKTSTLMKYIIKRARPIEQANPFHLYISLESTKNSVLHNHHDVHNLLNAFCSQNEVE